MAAKVLHPVQRMCTLPFVFRSCGIILSDQCCWLQEGFQHFWAPPLNIADCCSAKLAGGNQKGNVATSRLPLPVARTAAARRRNRDSRQIFRGFTSPKIAAALPPEGRRNPSVPARIGGAPARGPQPGDKAKRSDRREVQNCEPNTGHDTAQDFHPERMRAIIVPRFHCAGAMRQRENRRSHPRSSGSR
jgi:hypothetical protein